jgi:hypothetical protein
LSVRAPTPFGIEHGSAFGFTRRNAEDAELTLADSGGRGQIAGELTPTTLKVVNSHWRG